jgi:hypothetical protein
MGKTLGFLVGTLQPNPLPWAILLGRPTGMACAEPMVRRLGPPWPHLAPLAPTAYGNGPTDTAVGPWEQ